MKTTSSEPELGQRLWAFARHFVEMVAVMCIAGAVLLAAFYWLAGQVGASTFAQDAPVAAVIVTTVVYSSTMVVWMSLRGMPLRLTAEMTGSTVLVGAVLIALGATGILTPAELSGWADPSFCMPACALMLPVMLARWPFYAGHAGHERTHPVAAT